MVAGGGGDVVAQVTYLDTDGDTVSFHLTGANALEKWVNGAFKRRVTSLTFSGRRVTDQETWGGTVAEYDGQAADAVLQDIRRLCGTAQVPITMPMSGPGSLVG